MNTFYELERSTTLTPNATDEEIVAQKNWKIYSEIIVISSFKLRA